MKKKMFAMAALAAVCALSFGQGAGPQGGGFGPPQGPGMRGGPGVGGPGMGLQGPRLLMNPSVQKELKLTEEQKVKLGELMPMRGPGGPGGQRGPGGPGGPPQGGPGGQGGFGPPQGNPPQGGQRGQGGPPQGGGQGGFGPPQGGPPQGGQRGPGGPGGFGPGGPGGQMNPEMENKIKGILTDTQYSRYQEISLQQQGAMALMREDLGKKLGITDEQRQKMREAMQSNRPNFQPPLEGQRPDPEKMRADMEKHREATNAKIVAILTGEQKSKWQSMLGKPFKIEHPQGRPGFGGPGGPGGRGGPGGPGGGKGGPGGQGGGGG